MAGTIRTLQNERGNHALQVKLSFQAAVFRTNTPASPSPTYFDRDIPIIEVFNQRVVLLSKTRNNPEMQELYNLGFAIFAYQDSNRPLRHGNIEDYEAAKFVYTYFQYLPQAIQHLWYFNPDRVYSLTNRAKYEILQNRPVRSVPQAQNEQGPLDDGAGEMYRSPQNLPQIDDFFPGFGPASPPWPPLLLRHIREGRPASPRSPSPSPSPSPSYTLPRPLSPPQRAPKREYSPESEDGECSEDATPPPSYKRLCQWELEKVPRVKDEAEDW